MVAEFLGVELGIMRKEVTKTCSWFANKYGLNIRLQSKA